MQNVSAHLAERPSLRRFSRDNVPGHYNGNGMAQMVNNMTVILLFDASVSRVMPSAGQYTIRDLHDGGPTAVIQFYARDGKGVVASKHQRPTEEATMVLKPTDRGYEIQAIWLAGQEIGYEFSLSRRSSLAWVKWFMNVG